MVKTKRPGLPSTRRELRDYLTQVFSGFAEDYTLEELEEDERNGASELHSVMMSFAPYFGGKRDSFSDAQLKAFGSFVNEAVAVDDDLENAVSTCFLEHLSRQCYKVLKPHLSALAKRKTHA